MAGVGVRARVRARARVRDGHDGHLVAARGVARCRVQIVDRRGEVVPEGLLVVGERPVGAVVQRDAQRRRAQSVGRASVVVG